MRGREHCLGIHSPPTDRDVASRLSVPYTLTKCSAQLGVSCRWESQPQVGRVIVNDRQNVYKCMWVFGLEERESKTRGGGKYWHIRPGGVQRGFFSSSIRFQSLSSWWLRPQSPSHSVSQRWQVTYCDCVIEGRHGQRFLPHVFHLIFVQANRVSELCTSHNLLQYLDSTDTASLKGSKTCTSLPYLFALLVLLQSLVIGRCPRASASGSLSFSPRMPS